MKVIIYKTETGIAAIMPNMKLEDAMKDIPEGVEYKIVDSSELPEDRTFRNAWGYDLKENIPKSKEIWKDKLRADRKPLLENLDVEYQKADEAGDSARKAEVAAQKQILRDITNLVDGCTTIEEIKSIEV